MIDVRRLLAVIGKRRLSVAGLAWMRGQDLPLEPVRR